MSKMCYKCRHYNTHYAHNLANIRSHNRFHLAVGDVSWTKSEELLGTVSTHLGALGTIFMWEGASNVVTWNDFATCTNLCASLLLVNLWF